MSLIKCPDCGKEISSYASVCPDCGCPRETWEQSEEAKNEKKPKVSLDSDNANLSKSVASPLSHVLNNTLSSLHEIHDKADKELAEERIEELEEEIEDLENEIKDLESEIEDKRQELEENRNEIEKYKQVIANFHLKEVEKYNKKGNSKKQDSFKQFISNLYSRIDEEPEEKFYKTVTFKELMEEDEEGKYLYEKYMAEVDEEEAE